MPNPIGNSFIHPEQPTSLENIPHLAKQMRSQVLLLAQQLQKILENPSLTEQHPFLEGVFSNGHQLDQTVAKVQQLK